MYKIDTQTAKQGAGHWCCMSTRWPEAIPTPSGLCAPHMLQWQCIGGSVTTFISVFTDGQIRNCHTHRSDAYIYGCMRFMFTRFPIVSSSPLHYYAADGVMQWKHVAGRQPWAFLACLCVFLPGWTWQVWCHDITTCHAMIMIICTEKLYFLMLHHLWWPAVLRIASQRTINTK